jgi:hypothetical protein
MVSTPKFDFGSLLKAFDPKYILHIACETYELINRQEPCLSLEIENEYRHFTEFLGNLHQKELSAPTLPNRPVNTVASYRWHKSINETYSGFEGDRMYDPRSVTTTLLEFTKSCNGSFQHLGGMLENLSNTGHFKFIYNGLKELSPDELKSRISQWQNSLPPEMKDVCSEGDLADISYLGSKMMEQAFIYYFQQQCLSGSLGEATILPGGFSEIPPEDSPNLNYLMTLRRISQRSMSKLLMRWSDESGLQARDKEFWNYCKNRIEDNMSDLGNVPESMRPQLKFLQEEMLSYVDGLASIDLSVLRAIKENSDNKNEYSRTIPFVSQLDAVYLLRSSKMVGGQEGRDRALFADEMGCGKTLEAILSDALYRKEGAVKKTIIVCPNHLKELWKDRVEEYLTEAAFNDNYLKFGEIVTVYGSSSIPKLKNASVAIINFEMLHRSQNFSDREEEQVIEGAKLALLNGQEELLKDDEYLDSISFLAESAPPKNTVLRFFKNKKKIVEWIDNDSTRASYAWASFDKHIKDEDTLTNIFQYSADNLIVDEAQGAKNPMAKRTKALEYLVNRIPRLQLLTGTAVPNRHEDIDMPLKFLDPSYEPDSKTSLAPRVREIRSALIPFLARSTREQISPRPYTVTINYTEVNVDEAMLLTYRSVIEEDSLTFSEKGRILRLTTLHPGIALHKLNQLIANNDRISERFCNELNRKLEGLLGENYVPPKYKAVEEKIHDAEGNVVVFTSHVEGNTRPVEGILSLVDYLESEFGKDKVLLHDGQTKYHASFEKSERRRLLQKFSQNSGMILLASYGTLSEGANLKSASVVVTTDLPYALPLQAIARLDRIGQDKDIDVYNLTVNSQELSFGTKSGLTIDKAVLRLGEDKNTVSSIIIDGTPPGQVELEIYRKLKEANGDPTTYEPISDSLELHDEEKERKKKEKKHLKSTLVKVKANSRGSKINIENFDELAKIAYLRQEALNPFSYTSKSQRALWNLISRFVEESENFADIGGGPATLALNVDIGKSYDIIDPMEWVPSLEKMVAETGIDFPDFLVFQDYFHLFTPAIKYDILSANNMLHWTSTNAKRREASEREIFLRKAHATLRKDGILTIGLPGKYSQKVIENLEIFLDHTGYEILTVGQGGFKEDKGFSQLFAITSASKDPKPDPIPQSILNFNIRSGKNTTSLVKKKGDEKETEEKEAKTFVFVEA